MAIKSRDSFHVGIVLQGIAGIDEMKADNKSAIRILNESLACFGENNRRERAVIHLNLGRNYIRLLQFPEAREHLKIGAELNETVKDRFFEADLLYQQGRLAVSEGNLQSAAAILKIQ